MVPVCPKCFACAPSLSWDGIFPRQQEKPAFGIKTSKRTTPIFLHILLFSSEHKISGSSLCHTLPSLKLHRGAVTSMRVCTYSSVVGFFWSVLPILSAILQHSVEVPCIVQQERCDTALIHRVHQQEVLTVSTRTVEWGPTHHRIAVFYVLLHEKFGLLLERIEQKKKLAALRRHCGAWKRGTGMHQFCSGGILR